MSGNGSTSLQMFNFSVILIFSKLINTFQEKALNDIPKYKSLLEEFINQELIDQKKLVQMYGAELKQGSKDSPPTEVNKIAW